MFTDTVCADYGARTLNKGLSLIQCFIYPSKGCLLRQPSLRSQKLGESRIFKRWRSYGVWRGVSLYWGSGGGALSGIQGQRPWSGAQGAKSRWSWWHFIGLFERPIYAFLMTFFIATGRTKYRPMSKRKIDSQRIKQIRPDDGGLVWLKSWLRWAMMQCVCLEMCSRLQIFACWCILSVHCVSKKQDTKLLPITSPNVNRFSKFFHW